VSIVFIYLVLGLDAVANLLKRSNIHGRFLTMSAQIFLFFLIIAKKVVSLRCLKLFLGGKSSKNKQKNVK